MVREMGVSAEYVEDMSPSERGIFKTYLVRDKKAKEIRENMDAMEAVGLTESDFI
jgi:hypothetical protein